MGNVDAAFVAGFVPGRVAMGWAADLPGAVPVAFTPLSSALVHGGVLHLLSNIVMLIATGVVTERVIGSRGVLILYGVGAYAAAAAQWLADPSSPVPMIGASGAISAVVGASALLFGRSKARAFGPVPARVVHVLWLLAAWSGLNLAFAFVLARAGIDVAVAAHIGGFAAGLALARPLLAWKWRGA
ncbi:rhomboid family intramembrane serine protease [Sphingomonas sp.]|uniref:rhomboid family intramembrane serine protease n=1 Tax=Sphingomonas sp. TaxID=28214 RepID=UPI002C879CC2|nr:rhomboid family intramembrane serine protease [Sphingomonas sp.]HWK36765.1 rhomboid family intramembrane serine protease [Sphingomonas sp.]